jgi:hypothetical protein
VRQLALLTVSLILCAWFALGIRQASRTEQARAIVTHQPLPDRGRLREAGALLRDAGLLNPDAEVDVLRAGLALDLHDIRGAERILSAVVGREPMNIEAWASLALVAQQVDPPVHRRAAAQVRRLAPPVRSP